MEKTLTGSEFRAIRIELGLTQAQLGKLMNIGPQNISRIETGPREPTKIMSAFMLLLKSVYGGKK